MKQVVQSLRSGAVSVVDVPAPALLPGGALVALRASVISPGTERSKLQLGEKSLVGKARARPELVRQVVEKARRDGIRETYETVAQRLETPGPLGYSAAGVVLEVGTDCHGVEPGELVACAGGGYANHAEVVFVPRNLLCRVPDRVTVEEAAYATIGAIAMHGVRQAEVRLGERVAVIGLGLVGLLAVQLVRAAGGQVLAIDVDPEAVERASALGAEVAVPRSAAVEAAAAAFSDGDGVDAVLVCASTSSNDPVELAGRIARDRARVVALGATALDLPREAYYRKELELRLSRSYGPGRYDREYEEHGHDYPIGYVRWTERRNLEEFLRLLARGSVDVARLTTHRFAVAQADEAYDLIAGRVPDAGRPVGVVLTYEGGADLVRQRVTVAPPSAPSAPIAHVGIGLVGAGSFATRILLPRLTADERVRLVGVATAAGLSARHAAQRFGFAYAASSAADLLADEDIDAVVIATRHDSHAELAAAGLRAGKAVFCEKPLATTREGLELVAAAYAAAPRPLLVGFNRRFSPFARQLREALPPGVPRAIVCRVNAGPLPPDHWTSDAIAGGGRIVGELCHFLDLACFLAEGDPVRVACEALGSDRGSATDSVAVTVRFGCGSVASLQYLSNGDGAVAKERIEVFCGGVVGLIDDFASLQLARSGRRRTVRSRRRDKGHAAELRRFVDAVTGAPDDGAAQSVFWSSALTLAVAEALAGGALVHVALPDALATPVDGGG